MLYKTNNGVEFEADELRPCPFCGSIPEIQPIGNDATKTRAAMIKCSRSSCRIERTVKAKFQSQEWAMRACINHWNMRAEDWIDT